MKIKHWVVFAPGYGFLVSAPRKRPYVFSKFCADAVWYRSKGAAVRAGRLSTIPSARAVEAALKLCAEEVVTDSLTSSML
jgi:hypothetical protein